MAIVSRGGRLASAALAGASVAVLGFAVGCDKSKNGGQGGAEPAAAQEHRDKAAQLTAPAGLFGHIPVDTPYVFASFEPVPREYWQKVAPVMQSVTDMIPLPDKASEPIERFAVGFVRELKANMTEAGLKKTFGIGAEGRFALYGIGIVPVLRMELADGKALLATIERLQNESGLALPTASVDGRSYWRFGDADALFVVAVADNQLILSGGPTAMVEQVLPFILGAKKPEPNMADGAMLKKVAGQHGFAGYGVGYVDASNLLKLLFVANLIGSAGGGEGIPPACMEQITTLARRFPRLAMGYDEISGKKVAVRMVLETDQALATRLKELPVEVPGLVAGQQGEPALFTMGLGVDVSKARQLAIDAADGVGRIGAACGSTSAAQDAADARTAMSQPIPPAFEKIRGALVTVLDGDLGPDGKPRGVNAYGIIASDDPAALLQFAQQASGGQMPQVAADGKFHELMPAGAVPGLDAVRAAIKPKALVATVGAKGGEAAERALARTGKSPLFLISYDYGQLMTKIMAANPPSAADAEEAKIVSQLGSMFGVSSMWAYPTDHGLALAFSMEMR